MKKKTDEKKEKVMLRVDSRTYILVDKKNATKEYAEKKKKQFKNIY